jgi:hypothetical protein
MSLIVEDGSIVSGANTYVTLEEFKAFADKRGLSHGNDAAVTKSIFRAMDFFERQTFIGFKANENQPLQFPRTEAMIDGYYIDADEIPKEVKDALFEAIFVQESGNSQLNTEDRKTLREKVGDIEVTYANNSENRVTTPALTFALSKIIRPAFEVMRS